MLHYFLDLNPLFALAFRLLRPSAGATLVLREFHPISTKLLQKPGASKKWKLAGSYFDCDLATSAVAYSKHNSNEGAGASGNGSGDGGAAEGPAGTLLRRWTLGEVVTAAAAAGFVVVRLEEEPGVRLADAGIPKLFTLVARRP